jgi:uncharacterized membrane protein
MVADIISVQQVIKHYGDSDEYGPIIYVLLVAPAIMLVLLLIRIWLASKRNRMMLNANINSEAAIYNVLKAQQESIQGLILSPTIILTPLFYLLAISSFNKAERTEPNNPYIKKIRRRNRWVRISSVVISLSVAIALIVQLAI